MTQRPAQSQLYQFKLVLLGESAVGKSSLVLRFVKDQFSDYRESTVSASCLRMSANIDIDRRSVPYTDFVTGRSDDNQIRDMERYKSLAPMYYRNANCAIVVYDITQESSLEKAKSWVKELKRQAQEGIIIALAGNKHDLEERRAIATEDAQRYASDEGLLFMETSAKDAMNVQELFTLIAQKLPLQNPNAARGQRAPQTARGGVDLSRPVQGFTGPGGCQC